MVDRLKEPGFEKLLDTQFTFFLQISCSVVSNFLRPHGLQHTRHPCPSPTPRAWSNSCPSSRWFHPTISSSVVPFSSRLQSFPASGSFPMSQLFTSGGQSTGVSASVLPMNIQDWFPLGWTGWISLQSKGLSFLAWYLANKHYIFLHYNLVSVDWPCFVVASGPDPSLVCQCFH